jgi:formylglycine-generating enzyme required for sulfatase activity
MAPEQIEARAITGATDQWALAVTAYELLTGRKPFDSESVASLFQQILAGAAPDPHTVDPRLPRGVKAVFGKALGKLPDQRYASCSAFVEALAEALKAEGRRRAVVIRVRPSWTWALPAAAVLLAVVPAVWFLTREAGGTRLARAVPAVSAATPRPGEIRTNSRDGLSYVWVPSGSFRMGCSPGDKQCRPDETPHPVSLSKGFWMGQTEVTVGAYKQFCRASGRRHLPAPPEFNENWANDLLPIENVAWKDAAAYCHWAEGRLPTEAEWEFAARAGSAGQVYGPLDQIGWHKSNSGLEAREVGKKQPNAFGLHDTIGNVWEWTADRYDEHYYSRSPGADPRGPEAGHFRVLRGGSWIREASALRVSQRYPVLPDDPDHAVGFRCVLDEMP